MLVLGSRLLMAAAFVWLYEAGVFLYDGSWPNINWADAMSLIWGRHGTEALVAHLRMPIEFFHAPLGTSCFAAGLPLFLAGLSTFEAAGKRTPA